MTRVNELFVENEELRAQNEQLSSLVASGPRTPNTDMILGALLGGGNPIQLAKDLANKKES